ncbi:hypothetical protein FGE12_01335 [Aggregicoccus sp. 17bor-14]|uniref:hypothetical protein n=1 Tax=Myxococcaceae TaxID=31 RepID=UPI00129C9F82|nr:MULTISPECIES: hypothetical protein [Myxococcaceae]MBF5041018.1 hypothetical protein [Simulacricoccus sp. 17bor-14]MRI86804.1 hypothetical protein [Aggregicoccus sp. 17bor-14]
MSDARQPPDRKAPPPPSAGTSRPAMRAVSAARATPLAPAGPPPPLGKRVSAALTNAGLNALAYAREAVEDFRRRDRFFKFKAMVVAAWVLLSVSGVVVACPSGALSAGEMGARLVVNAERVPPIILIYNESKEPWQDVTVVVNRQYRASSGSVAAGGNLTLTPKLLLGPGNVLAPLGLHVTDVELRTSEGRATLMREGELR